MNKKIVKLFLLFLIIFQMIGCSAAGGSGGDDDNPAKYSISSIDISDAKAVMISPNTTSINNMLSVKRSPGSKNVFTKIKSDGTLEQVSVLDKNGNQLNNVFPSKIYSCNDRYVIFMFNGYPYLTNKITGSTYDLSAAGVPEMLRANNGYDEEVRKSIFADINDNIYYLNNGVVKKIDVSNPDAITVRNYTPDIYEVNYTDDFAVDNSGNVIFTYEINFTRYTKIKTTNGSLTNLSNPTYMSYSGLDGNIYFVPGSSTINRPAGVIKKVNIAADFNVTYSDYGERRVFGYGYGQSYRWLNFDDRIAIIKDGKKMDVYQSAGLPSASKSLEFLSSSSLKLLKSSSSYYYVATKQGAILKVDPDDDSSTTLIDNNEYDYYKMTVTNNDTVLFYALRLSDSKKVIGKISSTGDVSIIDDTLTDEVILLEKLN